MLNPFLVFTIHFIPLLFILVLANQTQSAQLGTNPLQVLLSSSVL